MARRLAYTRSVAVTSIVGYILGIGDRHSHNVLIDELTAEVVHIGIGTYAVVYMYYMLVYYSGVLYTRAWITNCILSHRIYVYYVCVLDFGIVFDQGKGLGTPETVPFRLTRDMIDGMSVCICI